MKKMVYWIVALGGGLAWAPVLSADELDNVRPALEALVILPERAPEEDVVTLSLPSTNTAEQAENSPLKDKPLLRGFEELASGEIRSSLESFEEALQDNPQSMHALFGKGTAFVKLRKFREALDILLPLEEAYPRNYLIKNNIAWMYATSDDPGIRSGKKAVAMAQEALLLNPGDFHVWSTLSEAYYISGEFKKAFRAARQAIQIAREKKASPVDLWNYAEQLRKCRQAVNALTLLD